jgi:hypothetical protein
MESELSRHAISSSSFASCHYLMSVHNHRKFVAVYRDCEACVCLRRSLSKDKWNQCQKTRSNETSCHSGSSASQLVRVKVTVQGADALSVVVPADCLREETAYVENDELLDVLSRSRRDGV